MPYPAMMVWELRGSAAGDPISDLPAHAWPDLPLAPLPRAFASSPLQVTDYPASLGARVTVGETVDF
ncbi:MAG: hypothetical protein DMG32_16295 [Acidobacteria bacterium]|nr:MAG: hypothetical protein DMG32_16295 [Acidobacteriota bacterium]